MCALSLVSAVSSLIISTPFFCRNHHILNTRQSHQCKDNEWRDYTKISSSSDVSVASASLVRRATISSARAAITGKESLRMKCLFPSDAFTLTLPHSSQCGRSNLIAYSFSMNSFPHTLQMDFLQNANAHSIL